MARRWKWWPSLQHLLMLCVVRLYVPEDFLINVLQILAAPRGGWASDQSDVAERDILHHQPACANCRQHDASIPIVGRANVCEQEAVELRTVALKAGY